MTNIAYEKSTYVVTCTFTDPDGGIVVPDTIAWSLVDSDGNIINNREDVEVSEPDSSVDIVLSGDDLELAAGNNEYRILTVKATYTSVKYGSGLPLNQEFKFVVQNLVGVS